MKNSIDMRETALHARISFNFLWATLSDHPQANCWYLMGVFHPENNRFIPLSGLLI